MKKFVLVLIICSLLVGTIASTASATLEEPTKVVFIGRHCAVNLNQADPTIVGWYWFVGNHMIGRYRGPISDLGLPDEFLGFIGKRIFCCVFELQVP